MPEVSVIMPVYNEKENFLKESIESILNQSFSDFEFLIVNDGSDEKTSAILENYAKSDRRITIINNDSNLGLTKSLNISLKKAQGKFIARMDSDDISLSDRLEKQLPFLQKNNLDLIGANCDIIDENGNILKEKRISPPYNMKKNLLRGNFFTHATLFGQKKVFDELYDENFKRAQDYEFLLRILGKGYSLGYMPDSILKYRLHQKAISSASAKEQEWFALKARVLAIKNYGYNFVYTSYILRALLSFIIPYKLKCFIIYKLNR
ncbi:MAG: glycosyltransferase family 2 protein [Candidatus Pacebacteria bacterium]|nr:glycosyltransferase family 2 protein [Candidatus Paceibacterota bacterium]